MITPYPDASINKIYDLLFCDDLELFRPADGDISASPWKELFDRRANADEIRTIVYADWSEARTRALAALRLREIGQPITDKLLFGTVIEVGMETGLDALAAYADGTIRYINHSGSLFVWDSRTEYSDALVGELLDASISVVSQIGPWDGQRLDPPANGNARLTFLVSDGLYFGEGPFEALTQDPMGGRVIAAGFQIMTFLLQHYSGQSE
ncbi:MAG: hypothetical protein IPM50_04210 [Acidobacteriota bacterium]|nr:MAG: hypothetical protein IPM50_04210 [Acidobacteriota bacterium]